MFKFIGSSKILNNQREYQILDTSDLSVTKCDRAYIIDVFKKLGITKIDGLSYNSEEDKLSFRSTPYGADKYNKVGDNYLLVSEKLEQYNSSYKYELYKRGVDKPIYSNNTPKNNHIDYLTFNAQNFDDKYIAIDITGVDKHYYREDREEYFGITIVLDITNGVKVLREDKIFDIEGQRNWYEYKNGIMNPNM